ncbi:helix-turn-helix domain-containing protein [Mucilaginibacter daejeonensis]|uniref:helix-turn-helix domain-containing protein n=1 Tax=Mucilaginibacter daejeonensis TaxID=398049 RepID=UPI001D17BB24|nr:helix-turn-helix domain-containing protein [Mucilaginibacter daejeonensis]UEG54094.1 helix-turn-helix domain-containing protein [Mucilaginibacter daejeonensis]
MKHQEFPPPEPLLDTVRCFWHNDQDHGPELSSFEVIPDGYTEIIFHFGNGCSVMSDGVLIPLPSPFMIGLLDRPVKFYAQGRSQILGIRCFPWTVFDLLSIPSGQNSINVLHHPIASLHSSLAELVHVGHINEAIEILTHHLLEMRSSVPHNSLLFKAGAAMLKANGKMPVSDVAEASHTTIRTLERNFKHSSGHTVKDVSALMRFEQVRNRLWLDHEVNLAALAHEAGYTDQAHLSREFKRYAGTTPAAFARKARQEKLDKAHFVAFVQSS